MNHHHDVLNDEAHRRTGAAGFWGQGIADTPIVADLDLDASAKALVMLTAKMATAGYSLHTLGDGSFLACRWGQSRPLPDLYAAHRFLRQVTGAAA
jgi:hypothetical protein